tara:strand:- start:382 stop:612 length:231 start_codon:yes stop_codon:yes gene_type:complete
MTTIQTIPSVHYFKKEPEYKTLNELVEGYFTILPLNDGRLMYINEDGFFKCNINEEASKLLNFKIYGNVVIIGDSQ